MLLNSLTVKIRADISGLTTGLAAATAQMRHAGESMSRLGREMSVALTLPIAAFSAAALKASGDFQAAMFRVQALSRSTVDDMRRLEAAAREMGATTKFTAADAADALGFMAMMGYNAQKMLAALPSVMQLAAASGLEMAHATSVIDNVMAGLRLHIEDLAHVNDVLVSTFTHTNTSLEDLGVAFRYVGPVVAAAQIPIEQVSAALGLLGNAGLAGSIGGTSLRGAITRLVAPTKQVRDALAAANIQIHQNADGSLNLIDVVDALSSHANDAGLMMTIFGQRAGPAMAALAGMGREALEQLTDMLEASAGTASRVADAYNQGLNGALQELESSFESFQLSLGRAGFTDQFERWARQLGDMFKQLAAVNPQILLTAANVALLAAAAGPLVAILGGVFKTIAAIMTGGASFAALARAMAGGAVAAQTLQAAISMAANAVMGFVGVLAALAAAAAAWIVLRQLKAEMEGVASAMATAHEPMRKITELNERLADAAGTAAVNLREQRNAQIALLRTQAGAALAALNSAEGRTYGDNGPSMTRAVGTSASDTQILELRRRYETLRDQLNQAVDSSTAVDTLPARQAAWRAAAASRNAARARGITYDQWKAANPEQARALEDSSAAPPLHPGAAGEGDVTNLLTNGAGEITAAQGRANTLSTLRSQVGGKATTPDELQRLADIQQEINDSARDGVELSQEAAAAYVDERDKLQGLVDAERERLQKLQDEKRARSDFANDQKRATGETLALIDAMNEGQDAYRRQIEINRLLHENPWMTPEEAERTADAIVAQSDALAAAQERMQRFAQLWTDIGQAFGSAFERAILEGGKLSDVLRQLALDVARLVLRATVVQPLANWISGAIGGIFGGGGDKKKGGSTGLFGGSSFGGFFADGGYLPAGKWGIAGEFGPEPIYGGATGMTVVPHGGSGGGYRIDARTYINAQGADAAAIARLQAAMAQRDAELPARIRATVGDIRQRGRL